MEKANYSRFKRFGFGVNFEAYKCKDNAEWLSFRQSGIGGSDVAPIMGMSPYRTVLDVWLEKTGREESQDLSSNEAVYWGTVNEAAIAKRFAEDHQDKKVININATLVKEDVPYMHANLDRMVIEPDDTASVLEVKTASSYKANEWEGGVPAYYITQVLEYLAVTGWTKAYVAVLIGGNDYREYVIERDEEDVEVIRKACEEFWMNFVKKDIMPQVVGADIQTLTNTYPDVEDEFVTPEDLTAADRAIAEYQDACNALKQAEARKKDSAALLMQMIGDAKGLVTDMSKVTWSRGTAYRFDLKRFKEENPVLYKKYQLTYQKNSGIRVKELR